MDENIFALQMQDITVEFPGVLANDHVNIDCKKGESIGSSGGKRGRKNDVDECAIRALSSDRRQDFA